MEPSSNPTTMPARLCTDAASPPAKLCWAGCVHLPERGGSFALCAVPKLRPDRIAECEPIGTAADRTTLLLWTRARSDREGNSGIRHSLTHVFSRPREMALLG